MAKIATLPLTAKQYDQQNEQLTRRTIEQALQAIRDDLTRIELKKDKVSSLSLRRFQFLHMGSAVYE